MSCTIDPLGNQDLLLRLRANGMISFDVSMKTITKKLKEPSTKSTPWKGYAMKIRFTLSWITLFVAPVALMSTGCASHRVKPMSYTVDNPYAPSGVMYETWEQKREIDGLLNDTRLTHTAIGAGGGAIAGQAIGKDTEGTLWGVGIGVAAGLTSGSVSDHNRKIAYEDHMTRLANDWQTQHDQNVQDEKDVAFGSVITEEQLQQRLARLEAARQELAKRDEYVDRARRLREIDDEIERVNATTTTH